MVVFYLILVSETTPVVISHFKQLYVHLFIPCFYLSDRTNIYNHFCVLVKLSLMLVYCIYEWPFS